ncbi:MAG: putative ABC transporter permease [Bacilli bacterium]|nr:putative ABC transporter permease [Bacilli bacterium]
MDYNVKELETWQKIGIACLLFVISGIIGWIIEFIFYYFNGGMKEFYWQGGNFLPWMNIYAIGAFLMFGVTYKYRSNPLTVFTLSIISATLLEFTAGYVLDKFFDLRFWDYNVEILNFGNINGYICLRSVLGFGIAGIFLMYVLIPFLISLSKTIPKKVFLTISICLCSIFLLDELYNLFFARLLNLPTAMEIYEGKGFKYFEFNK